jgi:hypothetical protein
MPGATRSGSEFVLRLPGKNADQFPSIATLPDGRFVVTWQDDNGLIDPLTRTRQPDGGKVGDTFIVNPTTSFQTDPSIAMLTDGRFVIAWMDWSGTDHVVRAQIFNADGTRFGNEFLVNADADRTQHEPTVTALANGRFAIGWTNAIPSADEPDTRLQAKVFNSDGTRSIDEIRIGTAPPYTLAASVETFTRQEVGAIDGSFNRLLHGHCIDEVRTALAA